MIEWSWVFWAGVVALIVFVVSLMVLAPEPPDDDDEYNPGVEIEDAEEWR